MNPRLIRFVTFFLVSCLCTDPACAVSLSLLPPTSAFTQRVAWQIPFEQQAFELPLVVSHIRPGGPDTSIRRAAATLARRRPATKTKESKASPYLKKPAVAKAYKAAKKAAPEITSEAEAIKIRLKTIEVDLAKAKAVRTSFENRNDVKEKISEAVSGIIERVQRGVFRKGRPSAQRNQMETAYEKSVARKLGELKNPAVYERYRKAGRMIDELKKEQALNEKRLTLLTTPYETFGAKVKAYRQYAGLSVNALAEKAALDPSVIAGLEKGKRDPGEDIVNAVCDPLGLDGEKEHQTYFPKGEEEETFDRSFYELENYSTLGKLIKTVREHIGWTQEDLAAAVGGEVTARYIALIEAGAKPDPQTGIAILEVLGLKGNPNYQYYYASKEGKSEEAISPEPPVTPDNLENVILKAFEGRKRVLLSDVRAAIQSAIKKLIVPERKITSHRKSTRTKNEDLITDIAILGAFQTLVELDLYRTPEALAEAAWVSPTTIEERRKTSPEIELAFKHDAQFMQFQQKAAGNEPVLAAAKQMYLKDLRNLIIRLVLPPDEEPEAGLTLTKALDQAAEAVAAIPVDQKASYDAGQALQQLVVPERFVHDVTEGTDVTPANFNGLLKGQTLSQSNLVDLAHSLKHMVAQPKRFTKATLMTARKLLSYVSSIQKNNTSRLRAQRALTAAYHLMPEHNPHALAKASDLYDDQVQAFLSGVRVDYKVLVQLEKGMRRLTKHNGEKHTATVRTVAVTTVVTLIGLVMFGMKNDINIGWGALIPVMALSFGFIAVAIAAGSLAIYVSPHASPSVPTPTKLTEMAA